jgi:hypothetical protein
MPINLRIETLGDFAGAQVTPRGGEASETLSFSPIKQRRGPGPLQRGTPLDNPSHKRVLGNIIPADCHSNTFSSSLMYKTAHDDLGQDSPPVSQHSSPSSNSFAKRTQFTKDLSNDSMSSPILKGNGFSITHNDMMKKDSGLWTYKGIQGHAPMSSNMNNMVNGINSYELAGNSAMELQNHREFLSPALSRRTGYYNRFANGSDTVVGQRMARERSMGVHAPAALSGGESKPTRQNRHGTRAGSSYSTSSTTNHMLTPR